MNLPYQFTPYILPMLATAVLSFALAIYGWRRRTVPGAFPFSILMVLDVLWATGTALVLAATDSSTKIFWYQFQFFWQGPIAVVGLCFVLEYARLNRFLNRRNLYLLFTFLLIGFLSILTNDAHHWIWIGFSSEQVIRPIPGAGNLLLVAVGVLISLLTLPVLIWLFIRSPQQRAPVMLILCGHAVVRVAYVLNVANLNPVAPMDFAVLMLNFTSMMYAIALFGFRIFDPIPMARRTVIEQMHEGMVVLDTHGRIVDLNPAAEKILSVRTVRVKGHQASQVLPVHLDALTQSNEPGVAHSEITIGAGTAARFYTLYLSPLNDSRGFALGFLILLHDVTAQKAAQHKVLEQQRAVAALQEREHLARELHDSVGQVLSYASIQLEAARKLLDNGQMAIANGQLTRLARIIQDAHADVREHILNLSVTSFSTQPFFTALGNYLDGFAQNYGIATRLCVGEGFDDGTFEPETQMQLFRIIQEALSNARKHAAARSAQVQFELAASHACVTIQDDGRGFDPALLNDEASKRFGLRFMRARAEQMGGWLRVDSVPGEGTRVVVQVPIKRSIQ